MPEGAPVLDPLFAAAFPLALGLYAAALAAIALRPTFGRPVLALAAAVHLAGTIARGLALGFVPVTSKYESFSAAALATALVLLVAWRPVRAYAGFVTLIGAAFLAAALRFPPELSWPPPLMRTVWYPLHVPMSFFAYGLWTAAAGAGLAWALSPDRAWLVLLDRLALIGFGLWSVAMVCGGVWGVVAWGAYFLWDPKVVWSVILWFFYAALVHVRYAPSLARRDGLRPALAAIGFALVLVAYVGTSFFFGRSSHAF